MKRKKPKKQPKKAKTSTNSPKLPKKLTYKGKIPDSERLAYVTHLYLVQMHFLCTHIMSTNSAEVVNGKLIRKIQQHIQQESDRIYATIGKGE